MLGFYKAVLGARAQVCVLLEESWEKAPQIGILGDSVTRVIIGLSDD